MLVSFFASLQADALTSWDGQWDDLCAYLLNPPEFPTKAACPLLKLAAFGDTRTAKGSLRHDANVTAIYGIEGDHDASTLSPEEATLLLQQAGIEALIYTSPSHTPASPRWRVLAPTSQPYAPAAHRELVGRLNGMLRGAFSSESFALSQGYYYGKVAGAPYVAYCTQGVCVDQVPGLVAVFPTGTNDKPKADSVEISEGPVPEWNGPKDDADLIRRALASRSAANTFGNKASFADLWERNVERLALAFPASDRPYDESAADAALASHLCFWSGADGARVIRLMQQSALHREKWNRDDYLDRTVRAVLAKGGDVLKDKVPEPPNTPAPVADAPMQRPVQGSTFLNGEAQRALFAGCVYVQDRHRVLVPGGALLKPDQFRATYGGYVFAMDDANQKTSRNAWEAFTESQILRAPIAEATAFKPNLPPASLIKEAGRVYVNTWWPANVSRAVGDVGPFMDLLTKMLPNERDRMLLLSYMVACVQYKGIKFGWWPVVQGAEGNGKTTLAVCLKEALGRHYVHWIDAVSIKTEFNSFLANRLLIAIEELRAAEHQDEVIKKIYTIVTGGEGIQIQMKGVDQFSTEICCNGFCTTNFTDAVRKTVNNARRFGIFFCAQQTAADVARDMPGDYFPRLWMWLREHNGFAIVSELLHTFPIPREFDPRYTLHRAPDTSATDAAISASLGGVEQHIAEAIAQGLPGFMGGWVSTVMLDKLLEELGLAGKITLSKRRDMLVAMGYMLHPGLPDGRVNNPVQPDGRKPQLFVLRNSPLQYMNGAAEIAKRYSQDQQISLARH